MTLTTEQKYIARKLFQLKVHKASGQEYENLFTRVMQLSHSDFEPVKPQGRYGDRKNDGFRKPIGKYFQVYAPEDATIKEKATIDKLVTDFNGLYKYWNKIAPIKEFDFVLNDKYSGAYPTLAAELAKIEKKYRAVKCSSFLSHHLEDLFLKLSLDDIQDILGVLPSPEEIALNVSVLNDVVEYLVRLNTPYKTENIPDNPDFEEKIKFNTLSHTPATILRFGSFQDGALKEYFKINSTFTKDDIRNTFSQLYKEAVDFLPNDPDKNDLVFFYIADGAYPSDRKIYKDAIFVLMSYFFSYCDIFEEPPKHGALF